MPAPRPHSAIARIGQLPPGTGRVRLRHSAAWSELVVDHPERAGAVSPAMMMDFVRIADELGETPGAVVVLRSTSGRAFCAGGDLSAVRAHLLDRAGAAAMLDTMTWALDSIARHAAIVIGAVDGAALGGGAELVTICDHIVMGDRARLGFVHAGLGVSPGWGGTRRLIARVGSRRALQLMLDPRARSADECARLGLADEVVPHAEVLRVARALARRVAAIPADTRRGLAAVIRAEGVGERSLFLDLWGGPAHLEALAGVAAGR